MDIKKTMEFILSVQAKLEASVHEHDERLLRIEASIQKHDEQIAAVTDLVDRLAQSQIRLTDRMDAGFQELRELHADTQYKLNALIETVDKLVRRDGHKK
jgi:hypothetical protein